MALRLDTAVIHGEIDNTTRGNVRGRLWLVGREDPITIDLRGDAWRDVAGGKVTFTNPRPEAQAVATNLEPKQQGFVGDITASRKVKIAAAPAEEWRNALYFEWFSEENGRVVVESADFDLCISEWIWEMDEAEEQAQKFTNLQAMRGWLAGIIQRPEVEDEMDDSEECWEKSLKQSDRLNDAHEEALEKFGVEGLHDDRVAFVMGWDHMLGEQSDEAFDDMEDADEPWTPETGPSADEEDDQAFEDFLEAREREEHPLQKRAHDFVLRLMSEIKEERSENAEASDGHTELDRFIRNSMNISGKLAGALGVRGFGGSESSGYILAILRRCLNWANEALAALNELMETSEWQARLELLEEYRGELFAIRDGITDLRKELREK
jgi:hypothetical protein